MNTKDDFSLGVISGTVLGGCVIGLLWVVFGGRENNNDDEDDEPRITVSIRHRSTSKSVTKHTNTTRKKPRKKKSE